MNLRLRPCHASLIGGDRRSSSGNLAKFTANRRASSRVSRFGAERCDAAICPESERSGSARLALETTLRPKGDITIPHEALADDGHMAESAFVTRRTKRG